MVVERGYEGGHLLFAPPFSLLGFAATSAPPYDMHNVFSLHWRKVAISRKSRVFWCRQAAEKLVTRVVIT